VFCGRKKKRLLSTMVIIIIIIIIIIIVIINRESTWTMLMKTGRIRVYSSMLKTNACFICHASVDSSNGCEAEHFITIYKDNISIAMKYAETKVRI
jgi:ascorbate-specific PTS system EIIC-type component UlaA